MSDAKADAPKIGQYDFRAIEKKWQRIWEEKGLYRTPNPGEEGFDASKPKFYVLDMFPYPSGAGLHVGHPLGYVATDIVARYKRMRGHNVLHPMGFDAFGLPAEQYAVETNVHPALTTQKNIETYRRQLRALGLSYDWSRELATIDPGYYKFTQWIFARMYDSWYDAYLEWTGPDGRKVKGRARPIQELVAELETERWSVDQRLEVVRQPPHEHRRTWSSLSEEERRKVLQRRRLAFMDEIPVNWCPALGTVLANEEVDNEGRSERGGHPVYRRPLRQWMLRITRYADRLLTDLDELDWPESVITMQRNWIGRSVGAEVSFPLAGRWSIDGGRWVNAEGQAVEGRDVFDSPHAIRVYTTRPDTLFGATYMVLAPEHPLVEQVTPEDRRAEVRAYVEAARRRSDLDRTADARQKTGAWTGGYALNPVNGAEIPIWVADYVVMGYGTGAIMAVPASDTRDYEFAKTFDLPITSVTRATEEWMCERLSDFARGVGGQAAEDWKRILDDFPKLKDILAAGKSVTGGLDDKTKAAIRKDIGFEKLLDHRDAHPEWWGQAFVGEGTAINSPGPNVQVEVPGGVCGLNGLTTPDAQQKIGDWLETTQIGRRAVNYKLRDWLFSRQRYWGEPFPVLHGPDGEIILVEDGELPVELPKVENFKPTPSPEGDADAQPQPPLARATDWMTVTRDGKTYLRDANTMPQWAGSCWYYLRFIDPHNETVFCDKEAERYWMPVDLYVGGAEHAVLHLLYARFWHKFLYDLGCVSTAEPFRKLFNQGMVQAHAFKDSRGRILAVDQVEEVEPENFVVKGAREPVTRVIAKMSKALKNVVNPDEIIDEYGTDTFRLYEMFMGPLEASKPWNTRDVPGLHKLCHRVWRLYVDLDTGKVSSAITQDKPTPEQWRVLHKTIKSVTDDLENLKFNTAIARLFDFVNVMTPQAKRPFKIMGPFLRLLCPFAPHLAEEIHERLAPLRKKDAQAPERVVSAEWPEYDEDLARDEEVEIAVQVMGKIKAKIMVPVDADEATLEGLAMTDETVAAATAGKTIRKVIVVKGRLVNIVLH